MRFDYSFVPRIAGGLARAELERLRGSVVRDSHAEAILKEALLDRDYDRSAVANAIAHAGADCIINSFADSHFCGANLLLRSEFLIMRRVGDGPLHPWHHTELFTETQNRVRELRCRSIIYRLCDYNREELGFLDHNSYCARGAQRLIEDSALLDFDLRMLEALLATNIPVDVLVPFVQFPEQFEDLSRRVRSHFPATGKQPRRIGTMIEVPANIPEIERFETAEFFVFGPGDLLRFLYGGIERNDPLYERTRLDLLARPLDQALDAIDRMRGRTAFLGKSLAEMTADWDLSKYAATEIRRLFLPSQIVPLARSAQRPMFEIMPRPLAG